jgi:23S rRNA pseudouridine1911/1915/1917 synthase
MERIESIVDERSNGERLDRFLASIRPDVSRSLIQREIREGNVQVAGSAVHRTAHRLRSGEVIAWTLLDTSPLSPAPIPLSILFEDDALLALDKPADLVVHPGAGTHKTTLVEGLLATRNLPPSDDPSRPGIVHRLDKGTSGIMVVAKTDRALESLKRQFAERMVAKSYLSIVEGTISEDVGTIDAPVGRDPASPSRMTVLPRGRPAQTEFQVLKRSENQTLLLVCPRTGRTHQIRTHLRYIGHPVLGDDVYGGSVPADRMFLHAWRLVVRHPETGETLRFEAPPPSAFPAYHYGELPWQRIPEPPAE